MTFPFPLPDWLPWWTTFAVLVPLGLYLLAFLLMPFSVFGLKGRLEAVEARLDEIQGEIRSLALRLPERGDFEREPTVRPPIPPAPRAAESRRPAPRYDPQQQYAEPDRPVVVRRPDPSRDGRSEPSFDPR